MLTDGVHDLTTWGLRAFWGISFWHLCNLIDTLPSPFGLLDGLNVRLKGSIAMFSWLCAAKDSS